MANDESSSDQSPASKARETLLTADEREYRRKLIDYRIKRAKAGVEAFLAGNYIDAVKAYKEYIRILEEAKCVPIGGLLPLYFKKESDMAELILLSGIYWDLVKIYDKTRTKKGQEEFLHYMEKFVLFTKGTPYEEVMSKTLKKYIESDKCWNTKDFILALSILGKKVDRCFVATELSNEISPNTLPTLRALRDQILRKHKVGRNFIAWYYRTGPKLALKTQYFPQILRRVLGRGLDLLACVLRFWIKD